jgi:hypothetical protein
MITINLDKAKAIGHDKRRAMRAEEFKPHDEVIMKQIPLITLLQKLPVKPFATSTP